MELISLSFAYMDDITLIMMSMTCRIMLCNYREYALCSCKHLMAKARMCVERTGRHEGVLEDSLLHVYTANVYYHYIDNKILTEILKKGLYLHLKYMRCTMPPDITSLDRDLTKNKRRRYDIDYISHIDNNVVKLFGIIGSNHWRFFTLYKSDIFNISNILTSIIEYGNDDAISSILEKIKLYPNTNNIIMAGSLMACKLVNGRSPYELLGRSFYYHTPMLHTIKDMLTLEDCDIYSISAACNSIMSSYSIDTEAMETCMNWLMKHDDEYISDILYDAPEDSPEYILVICPSNLHAITEMLFKCTPAYAIEMWDRAFKIDLERGGWYTKEDLCSELFSSIECIDSIDIVKYLFNKIEITDDIAMKINKDRKGKFTIRSHGILSYIVPRFRIKGVIFTKVHTDNYLVAIEALGLELTVKSYKEDIRSYITNVPLNLSESMIDALVIDPYVLK